MTGAEQVRSLRTLGRHDEACVLAADLAAHSPEDAELQYEAACVHDYLGREAQAAPFYLGQRATYRRLQGTEQFLGFYDVHADCLDGIFCKHKRVVDICQAFRRLRRCYPRRRLFVVLDNLHNVHDHPTVLALMKQLRIHPVWTPTESSWLNLIEAHFGVLKRFTVANTDDASHQLRRRRIYRYLNYRHEKVGTRDHPLRRIRMINLERH